MCCSFVIPFFCLVLGIFFNSPTIPTIKQGLSDVLLFVIPFVFDLESIFQQSYPIPTYKAGLLSDVLLFCDSFLCLSIFFNSPTQFPPKQGLSDVLLFVIPFLCLVLEYFQQSYPIPTYKAGIECAALL
jgi:hypothetical protein